MDTKRNAIQTGIPEAPLTVERPVYNPTPDNNARLPNPGTFRVTLASAPYMHHSWAHQEHFPRHRSCEPRANP